MSDEVRTEPLQIDLNKLADDLNKTRVFLTNILGLSVVQTLVLIEVIKSSLHRIDLASVRIDDIDKILDSIMPTKEECAAIRSGKNADNVVEFRRPK